MKSLFIFADTCTTCYSLYQLKETGMKSNLLPNKFKGIGMILFVPFFIICLWALISGELEFDFLKWPCLSLFSSEIGSSDFKFFSIGVTDPVNEIGMAGLLISLCLIALSREKDEDEMTGLIRMQSFVWSFWATAIILGFGIIFLYGVSFLYFSFVAIFLEFMLFIAKFNLEMHKARRDAR